MNGFAAFYKQHRPLLHYSAPQGWINDPNGLLYHRGFYHLYYQYFPHSADRGPMHWGHARSQDLFHWETLPPAIFPDERGEIFSGSLV
ncbi:MAG: levanase, partial [Treponema sp.]|nr:levanase [Treponema sp.]